MRQAYRQFIGAVAELLNGEAVSEEVQQVAEAAYTLFVGDDAEFTKTALVKR